VVGACWWSGSHSLAVTQAGGNFAECHGQSLPGGGAAGLTGGRMAAASTANHTSSPAHRLIVTLPGKSNKIKGLD
jgi:hypothetical protein